MKSLFIWVAIIIFLSAGAKAQWCPHGIPVAPTSECDYCIASQGVSPLEAGSSGLRWDVRSLYLGANYSGTTKLPATEANETYLTNQLTGFYHLLDGLCAVVIVPYTIRTAHQPEGGEPVMISSHPKSTQPQHAIGETGGALERVTANGLGDIIAMARYTLLQFSGEESQTMFISSVSAGVKLPTGKTDVMHDGEYLDSHLQPGSGSTDLVLGVSGLMASGRFALAANLLGSITGTGARGHRFGNYINADLTSRYRLWVGDDDVRSLAATFGLSGELRAHELQDGQEDDDSGGSVIYVAPGLQYFLSQSISFEASFYAPVYHYLGGSQLGESYRFMGGVQYLF